MEVGNHKPTIALTGFEVIEDVNERVQTGDMIYDADDDDWYYVNRKQVGTYVSQHAGIARPKASQPIVCHRVPVQEPPVKRRYMRSRKPK